MKPQINLRRISSWSTLHCWRANRTGRRGMTVYTHDEINPSDGQTADACLYSHCPMAITLTPRLLGPTHLLSNNAHIEDGTLRNAWNILIRVVNTIARRFHYYCKNPIPNTVIEKSRVNEELEGC